ncbi:MAG TPA: M23 family metallopeptidase [Streptosporangiaceae bacterium]|jgi:hypothetical protein
MITADRRFAQYWYVDDRTNSYLEVKNHLHAPLALVVRLRLGDGELIELAPFTVEPFATTRIGLREHLLGYFDEPSAEPPERVRWGDGSRPRSLLGNAEVVPIYPAEAGAPDFSGWVVIENCDEGLALVHPCRLPPHSTSNTLDSVWWLPYDTARVYYAVQNTRAVDTAVRVGVFDAAGNELPVATDVLTLPPYGFQLLALDELVAGELDEVGGMRLTWGVDATGGPGDGATGDAGTLRPVLARGMLIDESRGFSSPLWLHGFRGEVPNEHASELHAVGLVFGRLGALLPGSELMVHPHLLLRNVTGREIDVDVTIGGKDQNGHAAEGRIGRSRLAPGSAAHLDLEAERRAVRADVADGPGTLRLTHNGHPTDVVVEMLNVDETGDFCLYDRVVSLYEYAVPALTAISFSLTDDRRTFLILKNVTDAAERARVLIDHHDGAQTYEYQVEVAAQDHVIVDLESLKATRKADLFGNALPANMAFGGCVVVANSPGAIIVSDPTFVRPPATSDAGARPVERAPIAFSCPDTTGSGGTKQNGGGGGGGGGGGTGGTKRYSGSPFPGKTCSISQTCSAGHKGIDVVFRGIKVGSAVSALEAGTVTDVITGRGPDNDGFGCKANGIIVKGRDGAYTHYLHVSAGSGVRKGTKVRQGGRIGTVDVSGCSNGPHVHVERLDSGFGGTYEDYEADLGHRSCGFTIPSCRQ